MRTRLPGTLLLLMLTYAAASLFHFSHNAELLTEYPNMPAWLSRGEVYLSWLGLTAIGVLGTLLICTGRRLPGLLVVLLYALLGFDGLAHYALAPIAAHSAVMNLSIWLEVTMASVLLIATMFELLAHTTASRRGVTP